MNFEQWIKEMSKGSLFSTDDNKTILDKINDVKHWDVEDEEEFQRLKLEKSLRVLDLISVRLLIKSSEGVTMWGTGKRARVKILLVDYEKDFARALKIRLKGSGY